MGSDRQPRYYDGQKWVPPPRKWNTGAKVCAWVFGVLLLIALIPVEHSRAYMRPGEPGFQDILLVVGGLGLIISLAVGWFTAE